LARLRVLHPQAIAIVGQDAQLSPHPTTKTGPRSTVYSDRCSTAKSALCRAHMTPSMQQTVPQLSPKPCRLAPDCRALGGIWDLGSLRLGGYGGAADFSNVDQWKIARSRVPQGWWSTFFLITDCGNEGHFTLRVTCYYIEYTGRGIVVHATSMSHLRYLLTAQSP